MVERANAANIVKNFIFARMIEKQQLLYGGEKLAQSWRKNPLLCLEKLKTPTPTLKIIYNKGSMCVFEPKSMFIGRV